MRGEAEPLPYAARSDWLAATLAAHDTDALVAYRERAPDAARAHPTEEHFLPLFVAYGAAGEDPRPSASRRLRERRAGDGLVPVRPVDTRRTCKPAGRAQCRGVL